MGMCRALVVVVAATLPTGELWPAPLVLALAAAELLYTASLTLVAAGEHLPGARWRRRAVPWLIAGFCLLDALLLLGLGQWRVAVVALALFPLTVVLQRIVPAT